MLGIATWKFPVVVAPAAIVPRFAVPVEGVTWSKFSFSVTPVAFVAPVFADDVCWNQSVSPDSLTMQDCIVEDNFALFRGDGAAGAGRLLDDYDTNLVLVPRGVATPIDEQSGWQRLYSDDVATLFGRRGTAASAASQTLHGWLAFP
jgi:hypothetical protein